MVNKSSETSITERKLILKLVCEGKSYRETAKIVGRSLCAVHNVVKKFRNEGNLQNKTGRGRKCILKPRDEQYIVRQIKANPRTSVPKLTTEVSGRIGKSISIETVRNVLRKAGFNGRVARKKPFINSVNRHKRLEFAKKYINQDFNFWKKVIFSDESKFNIFGSDGKQIVWRKPNTEVQKENLCPTVKHGGGNCMVWGCMSANGVGNLHFIDTIMTKVDYMNILQTNLGPSIEKLGLKDGYMFQQDQDPKHTSYLVREWLLYHVPKQLHTPPQSPDLNPIENLWQELERKIRQHYISSKATLKTVLLQEWGKISQDTTRKLIESMPRRLQAVIDAKGYPTKY